MIASTILGATREVLGRPLPVGIELGPRELTLREQKLVLSPLVSLSWGPLRARVQALTRTFAAVRLAPFRIVPTPLLDLTNRQAVSERCRLRNMTPLNLGRLVCYV